MVLQAEVDTGWRKTPILVADMSAESGRAVHFVLGASRHLALRGDGQRQRQRRDAGGGAAVCLATRTMAARIAAVFLVGAFARALFRFTWYVDEHWDELDQRCVVHINVDSVGADGADILGNVGSMSALGALASEAIETQSGQRLLGKRMSRGADQSFNGVGLPALFGDLSEPVPTPVGRALLVVAYAGRSGGQDQRAEHGAGYADLCACGVAAADGSGAAARFSCLCRGVCWRSWSGCGRRLGNVFRWMGWSMRRSRCGRVRLG